MSAERRKARDAARRARLAGEKPKRKRAPKVAPTVEADADTAATIAVLAEQGA